MATSGSTDYTANARETVISAMQLLGIIQADEQPEETNMVLGLGVLNRMLKGWQGVGINLWRYAEATLFTTVSQQSYSIPGDRVVSSYTETTTSADASETDATIDLTSVTGVATAYVIGVQYSSTAIHWTTVNGTPAGVTVTLTDVLPADVDSGSKVYVYPIANLIGRPLRVPSIRRFYTNIETPVFDASRSTYFELPNKDSTGAINQYYYDPQLTTAKLYVWPTTSTVNDLLKITYLRSFEDIDSSTDNFDLPQEWLETIEYNLAVRLAPRYGVALKPEVAVIADGLYETAAGFDHEDTSVFFAPDHQ